MTSESCTNTTKPRSHARQLSPLGTFECLASLASSKRARRVYACDPSLFKEGVQFHFEETMPFLSSYDVSPTPSGMASQACPCACELRRQSATFQEAENCLLSDYSTARLGAQGHFYRLYCDGTFFRCHTTLTTPT